MRKRIHIVIGIMALVASVSMGAAPLTKQDNATSAPRLLAIYNDSDFTTTVNVVNTTDEAQPLPRPCEMTTCAHPSLAPHTVATYATSGSGVVVANYDSALTVYSEIASRYGRLRVEPCVAVDSLWLHDLIPPGVVGANSGVYVAAVDKDTVVSLDGGPQTAIRAGEAAILSNRSSVVHVVTQTGSGKVCAFAYGNLAANGSLFAITH